MGFPQYKDKQVAQDLLDLMSTPQDERYRGDTSDDHIGLNYGRSAFVGSSSPPLETDPRAMASNYKNYSSTEPRESSIIGRERARNACEVATLADINQIMKRHVDTLLDELDDVRTRFSQYESRTRNLENLFSDLKLLVKNSAGTTDGKLRQLENILREVQNDVQIIRDKQEIAEVQMQLTKLHDNVKGDHQSSKASSVSQQQLTPSEKQTQQYQPPIVPPQHVTSSPVPAPPSSNASLPSSLQQPIQQPQQTTFPHYPKYPTPNAPPSSNAPLPPPLQQPIQQPQQTTFPQYPKYPTPNAPPPPHSQQNPSSIQDFPPPGQSQPMITNQYQSAPPPPPLNQQPQYETQLPPQVPPFYPPGPPPQPQRPLPEEIPPYQRQPQPYPPNIHHHPTAPSQPPPPPQQQQQFYSANPNIYEPPTSRPGTGTGQFPYSAGLPESYPHDGSSTHYGKPRHSQFSSGGGINNPQLPRAKVLPRTDEPSETTRTRVPVDDVVDQVAKMGFSRDQVRATIRKLTEDDQSVDLNVVLDKLMNDSDVIQPQNIWR